MVQPSPTPPRPAEALSVPGSQNFQDVSAFALTYIVGRLEQLTTTAARTFEYEANAKSSGGTVRDAMASIAISYRIYGEYTSQNT